MQRKITTLSLAIFFTNVSFQAMPRKQYENTRTSYIQEIKPIIIIMYLSFSAYSEIVFE